MNLRLLTWRDRLFLILCWMAVLVVVATLVAVVSDILFRGYQGLSLTFLLEDPERAGRVGGIRSILVSTFYIVAICIAVAVPIALGTAMFLTIFTRQEGVASTVIRVCLDVLATTPSIVFGLFGSAFFCLFLGFGFSTLSGGLTLACMILPILIRMTEDGLRAVPRQHCLSGAALGLSNTAVFLRIMLPLAAPALTAALIIGLGRALSETAALLFTSGYVLRMPESVFDSGRSLSVHIYDLAMNVPGGDSNAYRSAAVLVVALLLLNCAAVWIMKLWIRRVSGYGNYY